MYLEKAILTKQELDSLKPIDKGLEERVMQKMRLDWNYHSNSIEGNSLTYGETKSLIMHHITADGKPLRDHFEITGHNEALLWVIDLVKWDRAITENFIRELHKLILKENFLKPAITPTGDSTTKEIKVGEYKTQPNHVKTITGEIFYFAEPHEVKAKMTDLIDWYNEKEKEATINPIVFATEFHYKFIRIHPFDDGNGRIARILMNFILMKHGYHPAIIKKETKEEYFKVLRQADANNIEPFVEYIAESVYNSLILMTNAIKGLAFEDDNDVDKQFWLLEQKIKGSEEKKAKAIEEAEKNNVSRENIFKIFSKTIEPLKHELDIQNSKFKKYYEEIDEYYRIDGYISNAETLKKASLLIRNEATIIFDFKSFKFNEKQNYSFELNFVFEDKFYFIRDINSRTLYKNSYNHFISKDEILNIVNLISKKHIDYIDQIISNN